MQIGSDGSHDPGTTNGAGGAIIAAPQTPETFLDVGAKCLIEDGMSSLSAEQYGITSGILALIVLCKLYGYPTNSPKVLFWIDNKEALSRARKAEEIGIQLREYEVSDYNMKVLMQKVIKEVKTHINITFDKVKSHQEGPEEDLPFEAILNNRADELAVWIKNKVHGPTKKAIPGECMGLGMMDNRNIFIKNLKATVYMKVNGTSTREYLMEKNNWNQATLEMIDWKGMQKVLEVLPIQTRIGRVQLIHHWQNTGEQKVLFAQSDKRNHCVEASTQSLREEQIKILGNCPFNG